MVPSIHNWLTLDGESTKNHFCKPSSASANLKQPCKPGISSPEVSTIIPTVIFFTKDEIIPGRLLKARCDRNFWCSYSSHSSASEIIDFLSSLHFESITPFVCPDEDTPLDSVKVFIIKKLKHQNANATTKLWKERIKFIERSKRKFYLENISTNTPDYEYHREPLRKQRRFVGGGGFEGKDSETAQTSETVKNRTEKLIQLLNNI